VHVFFLKVELIYKYCSTMQVSFLTYRLESMFIRACLEVQLHSRAHNITHVFHPFEVGKMSSNV
jgi:hypothetical protein